MTTEITVASALADAVDTVVTVHGTAHEAHAGAIVLVGSTPVYLAGMTRCPADWVGAPVRISGTLRRRSLTPEPGTDPPSEGIAGATWLLEAPHRVDVDPAG